MEVVTVCVCVCVWVGACVCVLNEHVKVAIRFAES
jgi:hypothetical protein